MGFAPKWIRGPILGRGSSATVSLAVDSASGETFAVKSSELSSSVFLQREQRLLASIKSPHVVSYLGFDVTAEDGRSLYNLFMEYASGGSVADEIRRRGGLGLEEWKIRSYTRGILMGLSYLHSVGIAHCDVKGKNVLVGSDGVVKMADLGCAKWVARDVVCEGHQMVGGTPAFMAPEVARGEEQGTPADLWAVGCTIIEMATGKPPWSEADDPFAAVHRIGFSGDTPEFPNSVSDDCRDFLEKCLRRVASERWSAEELLGHPFVSEECPKNPTWRSPKCVLDQGFWDSLEEDDEEDTTVDEKQTSDPVSRLRQLGGDCGVSCSTWDEENWITVRGDFGESSPSPMAIDDKKSHRVPSVAGMVDDIFFSGTGGNDGGAGGACDLAAHERDHNERSCYHCSCFCWENMSHVGDIRIMIK